jgi:hypothetical protein
VAGCYEHGIKYLDSIKSATFLKHPSGYEYIQKNCALCSYLVSKNKRTFSKEKMCLRTHL